MLDLQEQDLDTPLFLRILRIMMEMNIESFGLEDMEPSLTVLHTSFRRLERLFSLKKDSVRQMNRLLII